MKRVLLLVLILSACTPSGESSSPPANPAASASSRPDEQGMPEPVRVDLVPKMCAAGPCAGKNGRIDVYYLSTRIHRYAFHGDLTSCSHPPMVVYDATGTQVGGMGNFPVEVGSAQEKEVDAKLASLFGGSKKIVSYDCEGKVTKP